MRIKRIGVTTDFSDYSRRTFPIASALAKKFSAELYVLHQAVLTLLVPEPVPDTEQWFESLEEELSGLVSTDSAFQGIKAVPVMIRGGNIRTFGERLDQEDIDLVVIAARGRSGMKRLLLGSFTENLLRFAACPVLVFRESKTDQEAHEDFSPKRILVPHDFSEASTKTLESAEEWARTFSAKVRLLSVVDTERGITGFQADMLGGWDEYYEKVREAAAQGLRKVFEEWQEIQPETVIAKGDPGDEILSQAKDFDADLIVMGTHGMSFLENLLLGSVAEQTVRRAEMPVLLVRTPRTVLGR